MTTDRRLELRLVRRLRAGTSTATLPGAWTHGRRSTYNEGCKCDPCTDAETAYAGSRDRSGRIRRRRLVAS